MTLHVEAERLARAVTGLPESSGQKRMTPAGMISSPGAKSLASQDAEPRCRVRNRRWRKSHHNKNQKAPCTSSAAASCKRDGCRPVKAQPLSNVGIKKPRLERVHAKAAIILRACLRSSSKKKASFRAIETTLFCKCPIFPLRLGRSPSGRAALEIQQLPN